jgi:hypothetical protein
MKEGRREDEGTASNGRKAGRWRKEDEGRSRKIEEGL